MHKSRDRPAAAPTKLRDGGGPLPDFYLGVRFPSVSGAAATHLDVRNRRDFLWAAAELLKGLYPAGFAVVGNYLQVPRGNRGPSFSAPRGRG